MCPRKSIKISLSDCKLCEQNNTTIILTHNSGITPSPCISASTYGMKLKLTPEIPLGRRS